MIRIIDKFNHDFCKYDDALLLGAFNVLDTQTNMLMESFFGNPNYYIFHNGKDSDRYKRVVNLELVTICHADRGDDLSKYGFKLIGRSVDGFNRWGKI
jgi:hypothetical protein